MCDVLPVNEIEEVVKSIASKYTGIRSIMLIGSYAKGTATDDSDIDLIVDFVDVFEDDCYIDLLDDFESTFNKSIDLLEMDGVETSVYKSSLLEGGVVLYGEAQS